ncbi:winged helix DNA-binding domain-containing protein [Streptomyces sp. NBC_00029]
MEGELEAPDAAATQLADAVPALKTKISVAPGKPYAATPRLTSRVLGVMAAESRIRRGRPLGTWASSQFRWTTAEPHPELHADDARAELATHYLRAFGPATTEDVKWWTGWTLTDTRRAITRTGAVEVDLSHGPGHALPDHLDPPTETARRPFCSPGSTRRPWGGATATGTSTPPSCPSSSTPTATSAPPCGGTAA